MIVFFLGFDVGESFSKLGDVSANDDELYGDGVFRVSTESHRRDKSIGLLSLLSLVSM